MFRWLRDRMAGPDRSPTVDPAKVAEKEAIFSAAGLAHAGWLFTASRAAGRPLGDAEAVAGAIGALDGTIQSMGLQKTFVEMMALGSLFASRQVANLDILVGATNQEHGDMIGRAMTADAFEQVRAEAGAMAYGLA